jgi:hypothetical protein
MYICTYHIPPPTTHTQHTADAARLAGPKSAARSHHAERLAGPKSAARSHHPSQHSYSKVRLKKTTPRIEQSTVPSKPCWVRTVCPACGREGRALPPSNRAPWLRLSELCTCVCGRRESPSTAVFFAAALSKRAIIEAGEGRARGLQTALMETKVSQTR